MSEDPSIIQESTKHRGAPVGNQNALRHGFYAKNLGVQSPKQYDQMEMRNLFGEAAMLKDFMYKVYTNNIDSTDSTVLLESLRALSLAGMAVARVLQVHMNIRSWGSNDDESLNDILTSLDKTTERLSHLDLD